MNFIVQDFQLGKVFHHLFLKQIRKNVSYIHRNILNDNIKNDDENNNKC